MKVAGFDIGGANTDLAIIDFEDGEIKTIKCPECGNEIQMAEGCFICLNCGYSGCS